MFSAACASFIIVALRRSWSMTDMHTFLGHCWRFTVALARTKIWVPEASYVDVNMRNSQGLCRRVPLCDLTLLNIIQSIVLTMELGSLLFLEASVVCLDNLCGVLLNVVCRCPGHAGNASCTILSGYILSIFPKSEPGQLQKKYLTAWKITKDII